MQWNYTWTEQGDTRVHFESMWCQWWNNLNLCLGVNIGATVYWISVIKNIEVCIEIIYSSLFNICIVYNQIKKGRTYYHMRKFSLVKINELLVQKCVLVCVRVHAPRAQLCICIMWAIPKVKDSPPLPPFHDKTWINKHLFPVHF